MFSRFHGSLFSALLFLNKGTVSAKVRKLDKKGTVKGTGRNGSRFQAVPGHLLEILEKAEFREQSNQRKLLLTVLAIDFAFFIIE